MRAAFQRMTTANDIHDLVAPYALDALDEDERARFEEHLAGCERCSDELASLQEATAALAYAEEGPAPPPALRDRILEAARDGGRVLQLRPRRRWAFPAVAAAAAAAACVAVGLGVWAASLSRDLDREREANERALALVADPEARKIALSGADGSLVVGGSGKGALVVCGLEAAPAGKTYEAWVIEGESPRPAGTFDPKGRCAAFPLTREISRGATVAVTQEREGGVDSPTGRILFRAQAV